MKRTNNNRASKVFLSYAKKDRLEAQAIARELRKAGIDVWDPEQEILPGDRWGEKIQDALDSANAMVVLISPEGITDRSVAYTIEYALGEERFSGRLIPVIVKPAKGAPWILNKMTNVTYLSAESTGTQIIDLLAPVHQDAP